MKTKTQQAVTERAEQGAQNGQDRFAKESGNLARALRTSSRELEAEGSSLLTGPLNQLADFCGSLSKKAETQGPRELLAEAEDFGRRQPSSFFGLAVAAGFLATRFIKAGQDDARAGSTEREHDDAFGAKNLHPPGDNATTLPGGLASPEGQRNEPSAAASGTVVPSTANAVGEVHRGT